jgi:CheY-like chemotaxis protein
VLGNAVKFTARGGVTLQVSNAAARWPCFEIATAAPAFRPPTWNASSSPSCAAAPRRPAAAASGLTIARMLTDLMGGEMQVSSTPAQGSNLFRIRLFLPQVHAAQADARCCHAATASATSACAGASWWSTTKESIATCCKTCSNRSALWSNRPPAARNASNSARAFAPHLVFMDLGMPGIDGWETLRRIRQQRLTDAHIAILSANAFDKAAGQRRRHRAEDFIVKPLRVDELLDWIGRKLGLEWVIAEAPPPVRRPIPRRRCRCTPPAEAHLRSAG